MNKTTLLTTIVCLAGLSSALAEGAVAPATKPTFVALGNMAIFAAAGTVLLLAGFKVFDWALRRINIESELLKGNSAVGLLTAGLLIGLSIIIAMAMF